MHNQIVPTFLSAAFRSDMPEGIMTSGSEESVGREGEMLEAVSYGQCMFTFKEGFFFIFLGQTSVFLLQNIKLTAVYRRWEKESYHTQRHT